MSTPERALRGVLVRLEAHGVRCALIGGLAVSAHTEPRFTRDVDLAVSVGGDPEAERLVFALQRDGYRVLSQLEHETTGRLSTVRLVGPGASATGVVTDLLFASSGIEPEIVAAAPSVEVVSGLGVPVARIGHLVALKLLSMSDRRPQDQADVRALLRVAGPPELELARIACGQIVARGFGRGRDLIARLEAERERAR